MLILRNMVRCTALLIPLICCLATDSDAQDLALLQLPTNSAITIPAGQGLDLVGSAEPMGKGRFRLRVQNRSASVVIPDLGNGTIYTGYYGLAYGFSDAMDLSVMLPFLMDGAGGLNKYGSGDPVVGIKWSKPGRIRAGTHTAFQLLLGLPLGYKGEHALDGIGGIRQFSSGGLDMGLNGLLDVHFRRASIYVNGGLFKPGNVAVETQLVYGLGVEVGRTNRWISFNSEYQARVALGATSRAANILKVGVRVQMARGIELEFNQEIGFLDHPVPSQFTFGIRTHGFLSPRRRFASRATVYAPPVPPKRVYEPDSVLRLAIVEFEGFEEYAAGERIVDRLREELDPHDSLEVVDLTRYAGIPYRGALSPHQLSDIARKLDVDVIISGALTHYDVERFSGARVPYVFEIPETEVKVGLRYRVMWFSSSARTEMEALSQLIEGEGRLRKRVRLLPADRRDITVARSAAEIRQVHEGALDDLVSNLLDNMSQHFSWVPPQFAYADYR
ncbi:MAG: hypothetical protein HOM68_28035 [Gemmatimonadetes bacterium]|nr:hypothetical protein [Gemmatimonadota bacterium]MBT4610403.1 hypothetical protein [Gemmatimonadota bacterium]MBT5060426.1 hypothetical protein [Gemmatimonadota bacterium]MBT5143132.1 hypothetical protein [Gemmatimonadota bacterium]MBT5590778.1 hypothetical protein [Gemmatimonadota bacterium]